MSAAESPDSPPPPSPSPSPWQPGLVTLAPATPAAAAGFSQVFSFGSNPGSIPYGCANDVLSAFTCMSPGVDRTPAQWAQAVRNAFLGYAGSYPRVAVWHGTSDAPGQLRVRHGLPGGGPVAGLPRPRRGDPGRRAGAPAGPGHAPM